MCRTGRKVRYIRYIRRTSAIAGIWGSGNIRCSAAIRYIGFSRYIGTRIITGL